VVLSVPAQLTTLFHHVGIASEICWEGTTSRCCVCKSEWYVVEMQVNASIRKPFTFKSMRQSRSFDRLFWGGLLSATTFLLLMKVSI